MNKNIDILSDSDAESESGLARSAWLKENEALVRKLEAAYQEKSAESLIEQNNQFYGVSFSSFNLLIDNNISNELLEDGVIFPVPLAVDWVVGVVNIRGDIVPVIDFEKLISGKSLKENIDHYKIIIINKGEDAIGLLLDDLPKPITFSSGEKLNEYASFPEVLREHIEYAYEKNATKWICVGFDSFIQSIRFQ